MKDITIGIMGIGFVGNALKTLFETGDLRVSYYDKYKEEYSSESDLSSTLSADVIFLCVPTPFDWEVLDYDYSAIEDCLKQIPTDKLVVVKSTVQPGTCKKLSSEYGHEIVFNPEFLREATSIKDMIDADRTVLGGEVNNCQTVCNIYKRVYPFEMKYIFTSWEIAELTKIATNSFLATKVSFCNEIEDFCNKINVPYDAFREVWLEDSRIGRSHTQVTDKGGFSGNCFPKDLNALITRMELVDSISDLHKATWNTNCEVRTEFRDKQYKR